jgi:hypothetical protein
MRIYNVHHVEKLEKYIPPVKGQANQEPDNVDISEEEWLVKGVIDS